MAQAPEREAKGQGAIGWTGDRSAAQAVRSEEGSQEASLGVNDGARRRNGSPWVRMG